MWRNWQTRWIQNPVPVKGVSVRPRSPVLDSVLEHLREAYRTRKSRYISFFVCQNLIEKSYRKNILNGLCGLFTDILKCPPGYSLMRQSGSESNEILKL